MASPEHRWANNLPHDERVRIPHPQLLPLFQQLVRLAKSVQHGSLTTTQYRKLKSAFFKARQPIGSPMFGWAIGNEVMLLEALLNEGIRVRPEQVPKLHRYKLTQPGMKRLTEIEHKIRRSK